MIEPTEEDIGRNVTYTPYRGCTTKQLEFGVVSSFNDTYVFVRFGNDHHGKATRRDQLTWG